MLTVRFEEHSDRIAKVLSRKLLAAMDAAASELADSYRFGLQREIAPPHSRPGQIPHAFNEQPPSSNTGQVDYLSSYIESGSAGEFNEPVGFVGFTPSHVVSRQENYLIDHDLQGRPWVKPIYDQSKLNMVAVAKESFEKA